MKSRLQQAQELLTSLTDDQKKRLKKVDISYEYIDGTIAPIIKIDLYEKTEHDPGAD